MLKIGDAAVRAILMTSGKDCYAVSHATAELGNIGYLACIAVTFSVASGSDAACGAVFKGKGEYMKASVIVGIVLIVLGVVALGYKSFSYTSEETLLKVGPVEATADTEKTVPIPTWAGIVAIAAGAVVIVLGRRR
ncbi:hypothetical protein PIGHUM_01895 [Pigmentiphaga humi]|uniref:Uncharacterized protein n=2 Tax=Pigmentiphaga humi TaxID=2478468 RepID=A0A3P4B2A0_9BURK|nr:hypothetical protein PIGHUM_01895 [Pigmentiphaga humi]